tara:strand:- start:391 stop:588 length:198 start_codon:yes stop_codon:yes gene_type:complete
MSLALNETNEKLMLYTLRLKEGLYIYGGTFRHEDGTYEALKGDELQITDLDYWKSDNSGDRYPNA